MWGNSRQRRHGVWHPTLSLAVFGRREIHDPYDGRCPRTLYSALASLRSIWLLNGHVCRQHATPPRQFTIREPIKAVVKQQVRPSRPANIGPDSSPVIAGLNVHGKGNSLSQGCLAFEPEMLALCCRRQLGRLCSATISTQPWTYTKTKLHTWKTKPSQQGLRTRLACCHCARSLYPSFDEGTCHATAAVCWCCSCRCWQHCSWSCGRFMTARSS